MPEEILFYDPEIKDYETYSLCLRKSAYVTSKINKLEELKRKCKFSSVVLIVFSSEMSMKEVNKPLKKYLKANSLKEIPYAFLSTSNISEEAPLLFQTPEMKKKFIEVFRIFRIRMLEKECIENEKKFQLLYNNLPDAVFLLDVIMGKIKNANTRAIQMYGYTLNELKTKTVRDIDVEGEAAFIDARIKRTQDQGFYAFETIHKDKSGNTIPVEVNSHLMNFNGSKLIISVVRDISERKKINQKLTNSESLFRNLYQNIPGGVLLVDSNYRIRDVNEITCKITNYKKEELIGSLCDIVCPKGSESKQCPIWEEGAEGFIGMDTTIKCKNGYRNPILKNAKRIEIKGEVLIMEIFQDIKERKQAEIEKEKARKLAEESNKLKSVFLANMSHELRTPLNAIIGFSDLLKESENFQKKTEYAEIIHNNGTHLLNLIEDTLELALIESGHAKVHLEPFEISKFFKELSSIVVHIEPEMSSKGIKIIYHETICNKPEIIQTDKSKLLQIFTNLIKNAYKFTNEGYIEYGISSIEKNRFTFYVEDTGIGIPENKKNLIFERFRQADESSTRKFGGTGLGLTICKELTKLLEGDIWLESNLNKGSTFFFSIRNHISS